FHELKNDSRAFLAETKKSDKKVVRHKTVYVHDDDKTKCKGKNKTKPEDTNTVKKADASEPGKGKNK
ncbi:MAG: hypothetical protein NTX06_04670, partial [Proteobacteria bacterium]|nr:hypothetical protein [Pseudomonadota bacterium]